jgi:trk system potassium uptake protein
MRIPIIAKILGVLLTLFSLTLIPPTLVSLWYNDKSHFSFLMAFFVTLITGLVLWFPTYGIKQELRTRDGFLVTALFWSVLSLFGALPLIFSPALQLGITDAVFESVSGLTTTGATVITGLDYLPPSLLYYRQQLNWLGGIGIVVIAVAILPLLGVGGMQLYRAEATGPVKDNKLAPRIAHTAKVLFAIYLFLTLCCALAYWVAGMSLFDAVGHSMSTLSNGGFSTHDASFAFFDSTPITLICIFFMLLGAINFLLHFSVWHHHNYSVYFRDPECKVFLLIILTVSVIAGAILYTNNVYSLGKSFLYGTFEVVTVMTCAGFAIADFTVWPHALPYLIFMLGFWGACTGSTGGGLKIMRVMLLFKQGVREIHRLIHPSAVLSIKIGNTIVPDRVVEAVWGFFSAYVFIFIFLTLALLATGLDFLTAFGSVGTAINNIGPGLGQTASNFASINATAKWILCFAMLLGRLEVFTLLVLFSPVFWRS